MQSSATATAAATAPAASSALAKVALQRSDVPTAYQAKPHQADTTDAADQAALVRCIGGTDTTKDKTGQVNSPDYVLQNTQISSQALLWLIAIDGVVLV